MAEEKKKPAKRGRRKKEEVELEEKKEPAKRGRRRKVEVETEEVEKKETQRLSENNLASFSSNYLFGPIEGISNILTSSVEPCGCTVTPGVSVVVGTYPPSIYPPF